MEPTLSKLGGLAVVLKGVLVDTGVCIILPFITTLLRGNGVTGGVTVGTTTGAVNKIGINLKFAN